MTFKTLALGLMAIGLGSPIWATEEESYDPQEFRNYEMGSSRYNHVFELNYGGGLANTVFYPSLAWNIVLWGGAGAVHIPFVYWIDHTTPTSNIAGSEFAKASHKLYGTGLQLRYFHNNNYSGLFYGGGIRMNYWDINYSRVKQNYLNKYVPVQENSYSVIPMAEIGYVYPIEQVRNLLVQASAESGVHLVQESYEQDNNRGDLPFAQTSFYWNTQLGISYAF